jgi:hypothetical protein
LADTVPRASQSQRAASNLAVVVQKAVKI